MRLIDADALIKYMCDHCGASCNLEDECCANVDAVENAPTITPEDCRPHGRWEFDSYTAKYGNPYRCSQCKEEHDDTHNYCPNGGARMDLEGTA